MFTYNDIDVLSRQARSLIENAIEIATKLSTNMESVGIYDRYISDAVSHLCSSKVYIDAVRRKSARDVRKACEMSSK